MSNDNASELIDRAATQAEHAGKNVGKAAKAAAEDVAENVEEVADGLVDKISSDLGVGVLATSVSIYSGLVAFGKFRQVFSRR